MIVVNSEEAGVSEEGGEELAARLAGMAPERLAEEVISVWEEVIRLEGELATERQGRRALEMDLESLDQEGSVRARVAELEEDLRVSERRVGRLEAQLANEKQRRADDEEGVGRTVELQEENARLLRSEEEQVTLILDLESQLERLVSEIERLKSSSQ
ncbi:MAG: hypothetical protein CMB69_03770 [Euryarchaeota archaeon]|nr:hypothetical protein [Euryarchaeota archaeon]